MRAIWAALAVVIAGALGGGSAAYAATSTTSRDQKRVDAAITAAIRGATQLAAIPTYINYLTTTPPAPNGQAAFHAAERTFQTATSIIGKHPPKTVPTAARRMFLQGLQRITFALDDDANCFQANPNGDSCIGPSTRLTAASQQVGSANLGLAPFGTRPVGQVQALVAAVPSSPIHLSSCSIGR